MNPDKPSLRSHYRALRREFDEAERVDADRAINRAVEHFASAQGARNISGYLAFDGEPDITAALVQLGATGVAIHLPVIHSTAGQSHMAFRRWVAENTDAIVQRNVLILVGQRRTGKTSALLQLGRSLPE
ncbi:MAG: 5-formyltetrahydrofolate cyclo-ligase, partial [Xanthomonadales bacterium]|nr:5-formyltetrahydrofolate cyclo-ligase [Xanthomonadales bacterium]